MTDLRDIDYLAIILQTPGALTPLLIGDPGTAKTSKVNALARALELPIETVIAAIREPSDFAGLPVPDALVDWVVRHFDPTNRLRNLPVPVSIAPMQIKSGRFEIGSLER